jgi:hypothetical protein
MTTKKIDIETPEVDAAGKAAPKTSVGTKLMLERIEALQAQCDGLLKDNKELCEVSLKLLENYQESLEIIRDFANLEVNIFSPRYYRNLSSMQRHAMFHVIDSYFDASNLKKRD